MAGQFTNAYTHGHIVNDDGTVDFECSDDTDKWPWLTLGPYHPITVQAQNFWTSVGAIMALGGMEDGQWSALTWTDWECGEPGASDAVRGKYSREKDGEKENYLTVLFDAEDREIVRMRGRGVVFRNRNFEEWRSKAKREAEQEPLAHPAEFAPRDALGIGPTEHPLVSPINPRDPASITALVSRENGLPPANPMLGGSGDHVNSVHMIEVARQSLCLLSGDPNIAVIGGEMELNRYVELGTPFRMAVQSQSEMSVTFALDQLGRDCATITLQMQRERT